MKVLSRVTSGAEGVKVLPDLHRPKRERVAEEGDEEAALRASLRSVLEAARGAAGQRAERAERQLEEAREGMRKLGVALEEKGRREEELKTAVALEEGRRKAVEEELKEERERQRKMATCSRCEKREAMWNMLTCGCTMCTPCATDSMVVAKCTTCKSPMVGTTAVAPKKVKI